MFDFSRKSCIFVIFTTCSCSCSCPIWATMTHETVKRAIPDQAQSCWIFFFCFFHWDGSVNPGGIPGYLLLLSQWLGTSGTHHRRIKIHETWMWINYTCTWSMSTVLLFIVWHCLSLKSLRWMQCGLVFILFYFRFTWFWRTGVRTAVCTNLPYRSSLPLII